MPLDTATWPAPLVCEVVGAELEEVPDVDTDPEVADGDEVDEDEVSLDDLRVL